MLSEQAKQNAAMSRKRYDDEHMATLATKLPADTAEAFRRYARSRNTTVSRLLADFIRRELEGGTDMENINNEVVTGKKSKKVSYSLWESTIEQVKAIAEKSGVSVDSLVNGVLCEFIAGWQK